MDPEPLRARIGAAGDALLAESLPRDDGEGRYVGFEAPPRLPVLFSERPYGLVLFLLLLPVDVVLLVYHWGFFLVSWAAWSCERGVARLLGRSFFCPLCCNPMTDPLVCCPDKACRRVQPRLSPHWRAPLFRTCEGCHKRRWFLLGRYLFRRPRSLVCRDSERFRGCYRTHALGPEVAGRYPSRHVAIAGTSARAKLAVMAHLFQHLTEEAVAPVGRCEPAWWMTRRELELVNGLLQRGMGHAAAAYEHPGAQYVLARSFVLLAEGRRLQVFHNVADAWLAGTEALVRNSPNWRSIRGLVFVLDPDRKGVPTDRAGLPPSEAYGRLVRAIEEYCSLPAGAVLPLRVAVVLPALGGKPAADPRQRAREIDPSLCELLERTVRPGRLGFFSGPIPAGPDLAGTRWLHAVLAWVA